MGISRSPQNVFVIYPVVPVRNSVFQDLFFPYLIKVNYVI